MVKIIDMDAIFDKYISDFVYKNVGKLKPEEIEDRIPVLYEQFGNEKLDELDGKTPNEYYKQFGAQELLDCLKQHLEQDVAVSDFLCETLQNNPNNEDSVIKQLEEDNSEEYTLYLMNILDGLSSKKPAKRYLQFVLWDYSEHFMNFEGRICLDASARFGALGLMIVYIALPLYRRLVGIKNQKLLNIVAWTVIALFLIDWVLRIPLGNNYTGPA